MKIYSMTATFGKLEHETLTLKPGLNVIEAPNEWGKSTWCAFLVNMFYGIDTRAKTTKTALAEKDRYAPWNGAPMSGRVELNWNGRDITIERKTKGRVIFGDFRAFETESGLEIPELTSANCGQMLLGVERSVFTRAGFLKLTDLPLTQDDALRRRLNNLVTTGDESGAGDKLEQKLRDLKNKCRHNRTGLLPQAEAQRDQLEKQLYDLQDLNAQIERNQLRQKELEQKIALLENHKAALAYESAKEDAARVAKAEAYREETAQKLQYQETLCADLPDADAAQQALAQVKQLQEQWLQLQAQERMLPPMPMGSEVPARYLHKTPEQAVAEAEADAMQLRLAQNKKKKNITLLWGILGVAVVTIAALLLMAGQLGLPVIGIGCGLVAVAAVIGVCMIGGANRKLTAQLQQLVARHESLPPEKWMADAQQFAAEQTRIGAEIARCNRLQAELEERKAELERQIKAVAGDKTPGQAADAWNDVLNRWRVLEQLRQEQMRSEEMLRTLREMAREAVPAKAPDSLTFSETDTAALLAEAHSELRQSQLRLGQLQGQMAALGQESSLRQQLKQVKSRISQLEDYYHALELAQNALYAATSELQRRFAPRIAKRAQELFGKLTANRYDRLSLSEDLSLQVGAAEEDTLRPSQWRSDGTVDQLYLALRLAVAEELTPEAPLVLDDALVRFDDKRLAAALEILKECAQTKQVILFSCQSRETQCLNG